MSIPQLDKQSALGIALRSGFDPDGAIGSFVWLPILRDTANLSLDRHPEEYRQTGGTDSRHGIVDIYHSVAGEFSCPLIPGASYLDDLFTWCSGDPTDSTHRDSYNRARYAVVVLVRGGTTYEAADNAKVRSFQCTINRSDIAVTARIEFEGLSTWTGSYGTISVPTGKGYHAREATISVDSGGGYSTEANLEQFQFTVEMGLEASEDGLRLNGSLYPSALANLTDPEVTGSFTRDPADTTMWTAHDSDTERSYRVAFSRGSNALQFDLNNAHLMRRQQAVGGSGNQRQREEYDFTCVENPSTPEPQWQVTVT